MLGERKKLVWELKKELLTLTANGLFEIIQQIQLPGLDSSTALKEDEESCFDYLCLFMLHESLLDKEDEGFSQLLELKDLVFNLKRVKVIAKENLLVNGVEYSPADVNNENVPVASHVEANRLTPSVLTGTHPILANGVNSHGANG